VGKAVTAVGRAGVAAAVGRGVGVAVPGPQAVMAALAMHKSNANRVGMRLLGGLAAGVFIGNLLSGSR
jgi:hypothetical protein